jgi:hypothetical protein
MDKNQTVFDRVSNNDLPAFLTGVFLVVENTSQGICKNGCCFLERNTMFS